MSDIMKVKEVAELLRLSEATIFKLLREGKIPGFKIGASWRFDRVELLKHIEGARVVVHEKAARGNDGRNRQPRIAREAPGSQEDGTHPRDLRYHISTP